jgi:hypothetical protein
LLAAAVASWPKPSSPADRSLNSHDPITPRCEL